MDSQAILALQDLYRAGSYSPYFAMTWSVFIGALAAKVNRDAEMRESQVLSMFELITTRIKIVELKTEHPFTDMEMLQLADYINHCKAV